jgi:regulator of replication initiation timing
MSVGDDDESVQVIELENESLREEVGRHRHNVERLVEMLTAVTAERDKLRREVAGQKHSSLVMRVSEMSSLSQNNQQLYQQNRHLQDMVTKLAASRDESSPF